MASLSAIECRDGIDDLTAVATAEQLAGQLHVAARTPILTWHQLWLVLLVLQGAPRWTDRRREDTAHAPDDGAELGTPLAKRLRPWL